METNPLKSSEQDLIEQLQNLPLKEVPADLTDRVMARVAPPKPSMIGAVWNFISQSQTISFRPIYAMGFALLILGSFFLGQISQQNPGQVATSNELESRIKPEILENPESAYMVGRGLLQADNNEAQALAFLQRAALLEPQNPEFAYWEGVGHWANGETELERRSYVRGLSVDPDNIELLINLGHSYLGDRQYDEALEVYNTVLRLFPGELSATYNSGLIYRAKKMVPEEIGAWKRYLINNRIGTRAFRAVERLNGYGDYSFRTYQIGYRKIIIYHQALLEGALSDEQRRQEFMAITSILKNNQNLTLEVVIFVENDPEAARDKAFDIKRIIVDTGGQELSNQVKVSWFGEPEELVNSDGAVEPELSDGIMLFSRLRADKQEEQKI